MFVEPINLHKIIEINVACAKIKGWSYFYIFLFAFRSLVLVIFAHYAYLIVIIFNLLILRMSICGLHRECPKSKKVGFVQDNICLNTYNPCATYMM